MLATIRAALALISDRERRKLVLIAALGVPVAVLDLLGVILLVLFLAQVSGEVPPPALAGVVNEVSSRTSGRDAVAVFGGAAVLAFLLKGIVSMILLWWQTTTVNLAEVTLSTRLVRSFVSSGWIRQSSVSRGTIMRSASASVHETLQVVSYATTLVAEFSVFLLVGVALFLVDPIVASVTVVYLGGCGVVYAAVARGPIRRRSHRMQVESARRNRELLNIVGGVRELTVANAQTFFLNRYSNAYREDRRANAVVHVAAAGTRHVLEAVLIVGIGFVVLAAWVFSPMGLLVSLGVLVASSFKILPALNGVFVGTNQIRGLSSSVEAVAAQIRDFESSSSPLYSDELAKGHVYRRPPLVRFSDVGFSYPASNRLALSNFTTDFQPGSFVGVVGTSGSGKSTLLSLLLGLVEPDTGTIFVDDEPMTDVLSSWRGTVGYVPQDVFIFDGSIAENVAYGIPAEEIDRALVERVCRTVQLGPVIDSLPYGIDSPILEHGVDWSGGQKQRLGLARALYVEPTWLVLDEATSALDATTEGQIAEVLSALRGAVTVVLVTHRIGSVASADAVLHLDHGKIVESGRYANLSLEESAREDSVRDEVSGQ